jgi:hypothetical protein
MYTITKDTKMHIQDTTIRPFFICVGWALIYHKKLSRAEPQISLWLTGVIVDAWTLIRAMLKVTNLLGQVLGSYLVAYKLLKGQVHRLMSAYK